MIPALALILVTLALIAAARSHIAANDLKKQISDYDENSYS